MANVYTQNNTSTTGYASSPYILHETLHMGGLDISSGRTDGGMTGYTRVPKVGQIWPRGGLIPR